MIVPLSLGHEPTAQALLTLQRRAYAVEAKIIRFDRIPQMLESLEELRGSGETFLGWVENGEIFGALSYRQIDGTLDIHRLIVDPAAFRRGIGRALIRHIALLSGVERIEVATAAKNHPAILLFESEGFTRIDRFRVEDDLEIFCFRRVL